MTPDAPFAETLVRGIRRTLGGDAQYEPGLDLYPHIFETESLFPLQRQAELRWMMEQVRKKPHSIIMDIGSDKGGGIYHWCKGLSPARLIACEIRGTPYSADFERAFPKTDFLWVEESSRGPGVEEKVLAWLNREEIDVLFLDGDKKRFLDDFNKYVGYVADGGTVLMHDIQDSSPCAAFMEAKEHPRCVHWEMFVDVAESDEAVERRSRGLPFKNSFDEWLCHWRGKSCGVGVIYLR